MTKIYCIKIDKDAIIPKRSNSTDAGMDLYSVEDIIVPPEGGRRMVSTGLKIGICPDIVRRQEHGTSSSKAVSSMVPTPQEDDVYVWQAEVRSRSGLAWKKGVVVLNSPGTIDNGYRGEAKVIIVNHGEEPFEIKKGDRIAQLVLTKAYILPVEEVDEFPDDTDRGEGGFGSSGTN